MQQPEVGPEPIPTDEATEADEAVPATAPAADARSALMPACAEYWSVIAMSHLQTLQGWLCILQCFPRRQQGSAQGKGTERQPGLTSKGQA